MPELAPDPNVLVALLHATMPFGKYEGRRLSRIPEAYFLWFKERGFPTGRLGEQMQLMLEIKTNGLEPMLDELERQLAPSTTGRPSSG